MNLRYNIVELSLTHLAASHNLDIHNPTKFNIKAPYHKKHLCAQTMHEEADAGESKVKIKSYALAAVQPSAVCVALFSLFMAMHTRLIEYDLMFVSCKHLHGGIGFIWLDGAPHNVTKYTLSH